MHKYALSPQGASDMLKAFVSVTVSDLVLMIPVSLLYFIVKDYMEGTLQGKGGFYIAGIIVTLALSYDVTLDTRKTFARLAFSLNSFA